MEEFRSSPAEVHSIDYLNKKRKFQDELLEIPLPKHICWGQNAVHDSSSSSSTEPKRIESEKFTRRNESDQESAKDSNSFQSNEDSIMSNDDEANTHLGYTKTCPSDEPSTSTSSESWGGSSSEIRSSTKSLSISEHFDRPDGKFGSDLECSFLEHRNDGIEQLTDKELENQLYSNKVASSDYVLSSGRWSVNQGNQDTQQKSKKLTIDKEFEQYFSMLMLE